MESSQEVQLSSQIDEDGDLMVIDVDVPDGMDIDAPLATVGRRECRQPERRHESRKPVQSGVQGPKGKPTNSKGAGRGGESRPIPQASRKRHQPGTTPAVKGAGNKARNGGPQGQKGNNRKAKKTGNTAQTPPVVVCNAGPSSSERAPVCVQTLSTLQPPAGEVVGNGGCRSPTVYSISSDDFMDVDEEEPEQVGPVRESNNSIAPGTASEVALTETAALPRAPEGHAPQAERAGNTPQMPPNYARLNAKLQFLHCVMRQIDGPWCHWVPDVYKAVVTKYQRMPRGGWKVLAEYANEHFEFHKTHKEVEQMARQVVAKAARSQPTDVGEIASLHDVDSYNALQEDFDRIMAQRLREPGVIRTVKNKRHTMDSLDFTAIRSLDLVVHNYVKHNPVTDMGMLAVLYQTAQDCYDKYSAKPSSSSGKKEAAERRIKELEEIGALLLKYKQKVPLEKEDRKRVYRQMDKYNMIADKPQELSYVISRTQEELQKEQDKLKNAKFKKELYNDNRMFELYTGHFYRTLENKQDADESAINEGMMIEYWAQMWVKPNAPHNGEGYLVERPPAENKAGFPTYEEFVTIVKKLRDWKSPGADGIYNYYIKWLTSLHRVIYRLVEEACQQGKVQDDWFYCGITYLLPKNKKPKSAAQYRPITCMSNLYKLTTRCATETLKREVDGRGLRSENQMGTRSNVQGAKEHALANIALNEKHKGNFLATWVDVMKAYDSIDHAYLARVIDNLNLPGWLSNFIKQTIKRWNIEIRWNKNTIMHKKVERGILQGDSLSPLLFVLCLDPLSRHLTRIFPKVELSVTGGRIFATNHFLYIDDLKFFAHEESTMRGMGREVEKFFNDIGLRINRDKSATNTEACASIAKQMEGPETYKYLGVTETSNSLTSDGMFDIILQEICRRTELLAASKLSGKNLSMAINQYALSVINYYIGVIPMDITHFDKIDLAVRRIINAKHGHKKWANTQRLYLPRKEMGRGLHSMVFRAEAMLLRLWLTLSADEVTSTRRAAIMQHFRDTYAHISHIKMHLEGRYGMEFGMEDTTDKSLRDLRVAQNKWLYNRMHVKSTHKVLYAKREDPKLDIEASSLYLTCGILTPEEEANVAEVQDRNLQWMSSSKKCTRCNNGKNVDHLATKCQKLLHLEYTKRHNEVAKRVHSVLGRQIGLPKEKIDAHKIESEVHGKYGWIAYDKTVKTQKTKEYNRPDIILADRRRNTITIVEIGITNQDNLVDTEKFKKQKYEDLIEDLKARQFNQHTKIRVIPYVMTWEGIVTKEHSKYRRDLGISDRMEAHIQRVVIQETHKIVMRDMKPKEDYDSVEDPQAQTGWMPAWMAPVTSGNGPAWIPQPVSA
ncbi:hypothetical protein, conserved [Babesia bigemina]|uniref:Reverse transcriptase domain-containing protein n=1 Tax=Babesia bigemina TaxID=5866 RepID=A0A061BTM5_BABBI|nr:hypothetical protein, conserved [Babesia bigemina]CDR71844.1 hypothetical protein, conserved [Babesia bigemina]|eukprot:XP_012770787.1 hypothetical protein, conserved [Babesia bigemina]